ncbi:Maltodextrin phosphorylase [Planctomycetes bacterium Pan216]|uniref:Maltodextrin phosphorylase n=1 Tax=Kolteria novifilia TaxID=2527975 RepID=A0A518BCR3_9BACT|nr:Maltodextrin phosphorylase [Planctomycetes bacterium Pan216]
MIQIRKFSILPRVPERIKALERIASNLWWAWNPEAISLFRRLDENLFSATNHNAIKMLGLVDQDRLDQLVDDSGFLSHLDNVTQALDDYMSASTWFKEEHGDRTDMKVAYFSAEFGLHESLPIYSGGLGVLAGDHLKAASDLGIPLVGVGLLYQQGYFRQYLNADGWQQEHYPQNDFYTMVCEIERDGSGEEVKVSIEYPGRTVVARVWKVQVGRVPLYLLDANIPENSPEDRQITAQLYGGDQDMRVRQELLLGVGGLRAVRALGIEPSVCHMNEGHSAFLSIEKIATAMEKHKIDFDTASKTVASGCVFTTHTPVEAGNDMFPPYLVDTYMAPFYKRLGIDREKFMGLGRQHPEDKGEPFCMTVLALRLANHANGVSKLHGQVSRRMWKKIWPDVPEGDVPISSITNGIHVKSVLSAEMSQLYDRYLGVDWGDRPGDHSIWQRVEQIPDAELWRIHERRKERLVAFARRRMKRQLGVRNAPASEIQMADSILDPDALTIGFARRFATYKRGTLIFRDLDRLAKIVNDPNRPVQFIFAGKAHPRDNGGKELIAHIVHVSRRDEFRRRIVFLEDYDLNVARYLVQGVDVWLNNPRRPLEASGTSGMKGPTNGNLNMSVLDGWWVEGFAHDNGWAIGGGEEYSDLNYQDEVESRAMYELLEKEVAPLYYGRQADGLPRGWIHYMKRSMMTVCPTFNTNRMVQEYTERFYIDAHDGFVDLTKGDLSTGREYAQWLRRVEQEWKNVAVEDVTTLGDDHVKVGGDLRVMARIKLGSLQPSDVNVELYHGDLDAAGQISSPNTVAMSGNGSGDGGVFSFEGSIPCQASGQHGYAVRVLPQNPHLDRLEPGLIRWG